MGKKTGEMTVKEAHKIVQQYYDKDKHSEEDFFIFSEALDFLIAKEHDPGAMMELGGHYYEMKRFDLALKYYEMAATYDYDPAYECLGYIWYYGRTGERDFKKAFEYFSKLMDKGDPVSTYKVADMYKNGYYVEKDQAKYESMIEELYPKVAKMDNVFDPVPEVFTRLAKIRVSQGNPDDAVELYLYAKDFLSQRIRYNAFFGNMNIMKWLIDDLYELIPFDEECFDFYDMYYLLKTPHKISFFFRKTACSLESVMEGEECTVCFNGKWYHSRDDFFKEAEVDGVRLVTVYDELYGFEVK